MIRFLTFALVLLLAGSAHAQGATETHTVTVANGGLTDFYATLPIPQHDAAVLGDLLSVSLEVFAEIDGHFFYENLGGSNGAYQINDVTWTFTASLLGAELLNLSDGMTHPFTMVGPYDGETDYAGTSGVTVPYTDQADALAAWLPGDAGFASFVGDGTAALDVATTILTSHTVYGGQSTSGYHTDTAWTATITYVYDPQSVASEARTWSGVKSLFE